MPLVAAYLFASIALSILSVRLAVEPKRHEGYTVFSGGLKHDNGKPHRKMLSTRSTRSGRTAVVMFQQDEADLLFDWILYHAELFGADKLYVIDHRSTSDYVAHVLSYAETFGVNVVRFEGRFLQKHIVMTDTIHGIFNNTPDVDTVIPLDVDEFIISQDPDASNEQVYTTSRSVINSHLDALPRDGFKYKFAAIEAAACNVAEVTLADPHASRVLSALYFTWPLRTGLHHKTFYAREGFIKTDQGNHVGKVENDALCKEIASEYTGDGVFEAGSDANRPNTLTFAEDGMDCFHTTPLAILHYGKFAMTFSKWRQKMYRGAQVYGYSEASECIGLGNHYCQAVRALNEDPEGTRHRMRLVNCGGETGEQSGELSREDNWGPGRYYSTFMADALMGRIGRIDFTASPKLDQPN